MFVVYHLFVSIVNRDAAMDNCIAADAAAEILTHGVTQAEVELDAQIKSMGLGSKYNDEVDFTRSIAVGGLLRCQGILCQFVREDVRLRFLCGCFSREYSHDLLEWYRPSL